MLDGRKHKPTIRRFAQRGRAVLAGVRDRAHREAIETGPGEYYDVVTHRTSDPTHSWLDYADDGSGPSYDCGDTCEMCVPDWRDRQQMLRKLERDRPVFTFAERILAQVGIKIVLSPRTTG